MSTHCTRLRNGNPCAKIVKTAKCPEIHDDDRDGRDFDTTNRWRPTSRSRRAFTQSSLLLRRSLIAFTESYTVEELAAQNMEPRPGTGMKAYAHGPDPMQPIPEIGGRLAKGNHMTWADGDVRSIGTFRKLDQHETDCLIVREIEDDRIAIDELAAFVDLWGGPNGRDLDVIHAVSRGGDHRQVDNWKFTRQKGGIHSDPLIRIIAFRAWGRRDIDWKPPVAKSEEKRRPIQQPPIQNIPIGRRFKHQAGCSDARCDGQCVER